MATTLEKLAANIADDWRAALEGEFREDCFAELSELIEREEKFVPSMSLISNLSARR